MKLPAISPTIEPLETRIAPALVVNGTTATFTDLDGDLVTVKVSKGVLDTDDFLLTAENLFGGQQLQLIDFTDDDSMFDNANITITAKRTSFGGDGRVNVGYINATGHDLGTVSVAGDLGQIDAGEGTLTPLGLKSLKAQSLGRFSVTTQEAGNDLASDITGAVTTLTIVGDVNEATFNVSGAITTLKVGGWIIGGADLNTGAIIAGGAIGSVTIGGSIKGGGGDFSGRVQSTVSMGTVKITGSILGGSGEESGSLVSSGKMGAITIGGSLVGGTQTFSGYLDADGDTGAITINGDLKAGSNTDTGQINVEGAIASLKIGGALVGGSMDFSGRVRSDGRLGSLSIGGGVFGGDGEETGSVASFTSMGNVTIAGSLEGGLGAASGQISSGGAMGAVKITRDILGGSGLNSGQINAGTSITSVSLGGSLRGGANDFTGLLLAGSFGAITITGDIVGGDVSGTDIRDFTGAIATIGGRIASVTVGGSIFAGFDDSAGTLTHSGSITSERDLGALTVKGSIVGSLALGGDITPVRIDAFGQATPTAKANLAIGKVTVTGRVERAEIIAGDPVAGTPNPDAQIGAVTVGGDWIASSLAAGVDADGDGYGNLNDDRFVTGTDTAVVSKIASVLIKGQVLGTVDPGDDYGFVAQQIGSFKIGGTTFPLLGGAGNDLPPTIDFPIGITDDIHVREVALT